MRITLFASEDRMDFAKACADRKYLEAMSLYCKGSTDKSDIKIERRDVNGEMAEAYISHAKIRGVELLQIAFGFSHQEVELPKPIRVVIDTDYNGHVVKGERTRTITTPEEYFDFSKADSVTVKEYIPEPPRSLRAAALGYRIANAMMYGGRALGFN
jgi:hypothetical protein